MFNFALLYRRSFALKVVLIFFLSFLNRSVNVMELSVVPTDQLFQNTKVHVFANQKLNTNFMENKTGWKHHIDVKVYWKQYCIYSSK